MPQGLVWSAHWNRPIRRLLAESGRFLRPTETLHVGFSPRALSGISKHRGAGNSPIHVPPRSACVCYRGAATIDITNISRVSRTAKRKGLSTWRTQQARWGWKWGRTQASELIPLVSDACGNMWRRGWDSNPRSPCGDAGFQDRCIQPLCHLSERKPILAG
jgi:hypothetical protein